MSKHIGRDLSLWNKIVHGSARESAEDVNEQRVLEEKEKESEEIHLDEKQLYDIERQYEEENQLYEKYETDNSYRTGKWPPQKRNRTLAHMLTLFVLMLMLFLRLSPNPFSTFSFKHDTGFQLLYPRHDGDAVYQTLVLNHTFGNSWGKPAVVKLQPPKPDFNKVVFTLKTSVDHVQYDRLAHVYADGVEIWRTSTIEPGGHLRESEARKDVSEYASLFEKPVEIEFQLDNLLTDRLQGAFSVQLYAEYYFSEKLHDAKKDFFSAVRPADQVIPLQKHVVSLPGSALTAKLPKLPVNTTRAKLAVFASGNGEEEFWYSNVLDRYKNKFENPLFGHGPLRFVNLYLDDVKIASHAPQGYLFTGAFAPPLWFPVVSTDAFDLKSLDFDLTPALAELWTGSHELRVEISNGLDEWEGTLSGIGQNWIVAANLLTFENEDVSDASGTFSSSHFEKGKTVALSPPFTGTFNQILEGFSHCNTTGNLQFSFKNGLNIDVVAKLNTNTTIYNVQNYAHSKTGSVQSIVHEGKTFSLLELELLNGYFHSIRTKIANPIILHGLEQQETNGTSLKVAIVAGRNSAVQLNGENVLLVEKIQNGTSNFHLDPKGNYGTGKLESKYKLKMFEPWGDVKYGRKVKSADGEIISDENLDFADDFEVSSVERLATSSETVVEPADVENAQEKPFKRVLRKWT